MTVEATNENGIPVKLPSGGTYHVLTNMEKQFFEDKVKRYMDEFHFTNISDLSEVDRIVVGEVIHHRWSAWISKGRDYFGEEINSTTLSRSANDISHEVRQLKKNLGMDKVTRDKVSGDDSIPAYWDALLRRAKEFGYMRNEQAVQAITSMMRIDALLTLHFNCLTGDTEVITFDGVKPIKDLVGTARLLDGNGGWVDAPVRSYGVQDVMEVVLKRSGTTRSIRSTPNHNWIVNSRAGQRSHNGNQKIPTTDLRPGDRFTVMTGKGKTNVLSPWGVGHGIVFGDGSRSSSQPTSPSHVRLCGGKAELVEWFPLSPVRMMDGDPFVTGLPNTWKDRPSLQMDTSYLCGWLAGYIATDGSINTSGAVHLDSSVRENVEFARDVSVRLSIPVSGISETSMKGFDGKEHTSYRIRYPVGAVPESMLIRSFHKGRFKEREGKLLPWEVVEVRPAGREEVFCPTVESTGTFTLEGNILTGNCDEAERREFHAEWEDIVALIREELEKFHNIDDEFRKNVQRYWIRDV